MVDTSGSTPTANAATEHAQEAHLEFRSVTKRFKTDGTGEPLTALADVSFSVRDGEFCAIVGPSGCGKSTLLNLASGLDRPSAGKVFYRGTPIEAVPESVGYVTQNSNLLPWMSVQDNVALGLEIRRLPKQQRREMAREWLSLVGLEGFETFYPDQLSGGMQKRCSIARSFVYHPDVILMDEPFGPLDAITRLVLQDLLAELCLATGRTVLFVTHDLWEALALADKVVVMAGRPGAVRAVVDVPIAKPRDVYHVTEQGEFAAIHAELWSLLGSGNTLDAKKDLRRDLTRPPSLTPKAPQKGWRRLGRGGRVGQ